MTGFWDGSGISWAICKQSAPSCRQITTLTPHHSIVTGRMLFLTSNQRGQSTEVYGYESGEIMIVNRPILADIRTTSQKLTMI